jgi:hypothetical protein
MDMGKVHSLFLKGKRFFQAAHAEVSWVTCAPQWEGKKVGVGYRNKHSAGGKE